MALGYVLTVGFLCIASVACTDKKPVSAASLDTLQGSVAQAVPDSTPVLPDADSVRAIAGWLRLRQAADTPDSAARAALYAKIDLPVARARIRWVEAAALEKFGDRQGALRVYSTLDAPISVFRLRYDLATTDGDRAGVRRALLAFIVSARSAGRVRDGYWLFDQLVPHPTSHEQLAIARAAADVGAWSRARDGFRSADERGLLNAHDRFHYAKAYARLNEDAKAAEQYAKVTAPRALAAAARYQRARAFVALGELSKAKSQLHAITDAYPTDTSSAAALTLLADLATDQRNDAEARDLLRRIVKRFPQSRYALPAHLNTAFESYVLGEYKTAASEFAALVHTREGVVARYWYGRTQDKLGNHTKARAEWRYILAHDSTSYYAALAAKRLHTRNLHDFPDSVVYPHVPSVDSALHRIALLRSLHMTPEVGFENEYLFHEALSNHNRLLATAAAFAGTDQAGKAIALGRRALSQYGPSTAVYRLIYPLAARDTIIRSARAHGIDPILVASLIRQESNFNPHAVSPVGARGLMQLMPSVAKRIAKERGIPHWSTEKLYEPGINIMLGVDHLAPLVHSQPNIVRVLAAYNAGESRVALWAQKRAAADPEVFAERIPFSETRHYVKNVLRNREFYRALYTW